MSLSSISFSVAARQTRGAASAAAANLTCVAYRGDNEHAPENTLAAVREAFYHGADRVVVDVRLSADGQPVLMRDATLDRTTNGHGPVERAAVADLKSMDAGYWFSPPFMGEPVATLAETLDWAEGKIPLGVSLPVDASTQLIGAVLDRVRQKDVALVSRDRALIERLHREEPSVSTGYVFTHTNKGLTMAAALGCLVGMSIASFSLPPLAVAAVGALSAAAGAVAHSVTRHRRVLRQALNSPAQALIPSNMHVSRRWVQQAHERGKVVLLSVGDATPARSRAERLGVDGVVVNRPADWKKASPLQEAAALHDRCGQALSHLPGVVSVHADAESFQVLADTTRSADTLTRILSPKVGEYAVHVRAAQAEAISTPQAEAIPTPSQGNFTLRYQDSLLALPGVYSILPHHTRADVYRIMAYSEDDVRFLKALLRPQIDDMHMSVIRVRITPGIKTKGN